MPPAYSRVKDEKDYFYNLLGNIEYAIVLSNGDGNILGFNDVFVKIIGFPERELCKMGVFTLIGNEFREELKSLFKKIRVGVTQGIKTMIVTRAQKNVAVTLNATSFRLGEERLVLATIVTCK